MNTDWAAILMSFLSSWTRLFTDWIRHISVTTQNCTSLNLLRNTSRLAVIRPKLWRPNTRYVSSYWKQNQQYFCIKHGDQRVFFNLNHHRCFTGLTGLLIIASFFQRGTIFIHQMYKVVSRYRDPQLQLGENYS